MNEINNEIINLNIAERMALSAKLLGNLLEQKEQIESWRNLTGHRFFRNTIFGEFGTYLVSIIEGIPGIPVPSRGMDLIDGSEIKVAASLNSSSTRWNFLRRLNNSTQVEDALIEMRSLKLYLVLFDYSNEGNFRSRVWRVIPSQNEIFMERYQQWISSLGEQRSQYNFQIFTPKAYTDDIFARHGGVGSFPSIQIPLQDVPGGDLIFWAEQIKEKIEVKHFNSSKNSNQDMEG